MIINILLWLDDKRNPFKKPVGKPDTWINMFSPIGKNVKVEWIKSYDDFCNWIEENGVPAAICFDHDLGDPNGNGFDCCVFLLKYCLTHSINFPPYSIQSANPNGRIKIEMLIKDTLSNPENFLNSVENIKNIKFPKGTNKPEAAIPLSIKEEKEKFWDFFKRIS